VTAPAAAGLIVTLGRFVFYNNMNVRRTGWNERATVGLRETSGKRSIQPCNRLVPPRLYPPPRNPNDD